jgi:acetylglutamate synthase
LLCCRKTPKRSPMSRKKISTTMYLDPKTFARFKEIAKHRRVPMAVLMREAMDYLVTLDAVGLLTTGMPK